MDPPAPPLTLDLTDSEVARIDATALGCDIVLSAGHVRWAGGEGYLRGVLLRLTALAPANLAALIPGRLHDGELRVQGTTHRRLPLPSRWTGPLVLTLHGAHHGELVLQAQALEVQRPEAALIRDALAC